MLFYYCSCNVTYILLVYWFSFGPVCSCSECLYIGGMACVLLNVAHFLYVLNIGLCVLVSVFVIHI
jgi:hypothetical protein